MSIAIGFHEGLRFSEYLDLDAINCSLLKRGRRSMAHLRDAMDTPRRAPSRAMEFGELVHTAALEPLEIGNRYCVMPPFEDQVTKADGERPSNPKATGEYKRLVREFTDVNAHRTIVSQDDYDAMMTISRQLAAHPLASDLLSGGRSEVSAVWRDAGTGVECKARIDLLRLRPHSPVSRVIDLKTTQDASKFPDAIARFGYHMQAAYYIDAVTAITGEDPEFWFVVVESEAPHAVRVAPAGEEMVQAGRDEYRQLLVAYAECLRSGEWPGYADPNEWQLPYWAQPKLTGIEI